MTTTPRSADYSGWSREQLIERLLALEGPQSVNEPKPASSPAPVVPAPQKQSEGQNGTTIPLQSGLIRPSSAREFKFSKHPKRKIALKFCYSGWEYCGLAYQTGATQLPTVEAVLFEALAKARLIDREEGMEGCGWEKCGRTDKGVSAAGQVISLWLRSAVGNVETGKGKQKEVGPVNSVQEDCTNQLQDSGLPGLTEEDFGTLDLSEPDSPATEAKVHEDSSSKPRHELDYIGILNRLLPPTIRILAWAPVAETFSARFSCKYRHYKYFFSSHLLDISAMRQAAMRLIGEHDFRNLCKVDAQKQITMFRRVISRADIEPVGLNNNDGEGIFVFNLVGSAFLYHQVRHIMAILFLVGTGLEEPSLVTKLMNVSDGAENYDFVTCETRLEVMDRKPEYQMADGLPLMLWDCAYAEEDVIWRTGTLEPSDHDNDNTDEDSRRSGLATETDLYHQLHSIWNRSRIYTVLDQHFLKAVEAHHKPPISPLPITAGAPLNHSISLNYPLGGGTYKRVQKYVPVLTRNRLDTVEAINERWRNGKGSRKAERKAVSGEAADDNGDE